MNIFSYVRLFFGDLRIFCMYVCVGDRMVIVKDERGKVFVECFLVVVLKLILVIW